jgi:hypothetical protein
MPTLGGASEIIASPVFHEDNFDPGEEASVTTHPRKYRTIA